MVRSVPEVILRASAMPSPSKRCRAGKGIYEKRIVSGEVIRGGKGREVHGTDEGVTGANVLIKSAP